MKHTLVYFYSNACLCNDSSRYRLRRQLLSIIWVKRYPNNAQQLPLSWYSEDLQKWNDD